MSRQPPDTAPNQNIRIEFQILVGNRQSVFDFQADAYVISAYRLGLSIPQITSDLCRSGYAASTVQVVDSLGRQGVQIMSRAAELGFAVLSWDARADAFTLAAHQIGQTSVQVLAGLTRAGYRPTVEEVEASLDRQGVQRA